MKFEKVEVPGARRRRNVTLALLMACMVAACGGGDSLKKASPAPADPVVVPVPTIQAGTWVVMGSSTAAGAGAATDKGWVAVLQGELAASGARIANIARGGTVTYEGLSTATPAVSGRPFPDPSANVDQALSRKPVLLIVSYPTNDTALGYRTDETVNNILSIRSHSRTACL
jgi:acyl-CoA thioesterase-1